MVRPSAYLISSSSKNRSSSFSQSTTQTQNSNTSKTTKDESSHPSETTSSPSSSPTIKFYATINEQETTSDSLEPVSSVCMCNTNHEIADEILILLKPHEEETSSGFSDNPFVLDSSITSGLTSSLPGTLTASSTDDSEIPFFRLGSHEKPFFGRWTTITATNLPEKYDSTTTSEDTSQTTNTYDTSSAPCLREYRPKKRYFRRNFFGNFNHLWAHHFLPRVTESSNTTDSEKTILAKSLTVIDHISLSSDQNLPNPVKPKNTTLKSRTLTHKSADKSTSMAIEDLQKEPDMLGDITHNPFLGYACNPEIYRDIKNQEMLLINHANVSDHPKNMLGQELPGDGKDHEWFQVENESKVVKNNSCRKVRSKRTVKNKSKLTWSADINSPCGELLISAKISGRNTESTNSPSSSSSKNKNYKKSIVMLSKSKALSRPGLYSKVLQPTFFPFSKSSLKTNSRKSSGKNSPNPGRKLWNIIPINCKRTKISSVCISKAKHCHTKKSKSCASAKKSAATSHHSKNNQCNPNSSNTSPPNIFLSPSGTTAKESKFNSNFSPSSKYSAHNTADPFTHQNSNSPSYNERSLSGKYFVKEENLKATSSPAFLLDSSLTSGTSKFNLNLPNSTEENAKNLAASLSNPYSCLKTKYRQILNEGLSPASIRRSKWYEEWYHSGGQKCVENDFDVINHRSNQFPKRSSETSVDKRLFISKCNTVQNASLNPEVNNEISKEGRRVSPKKHSNAKTRNRKKSPRRAETMCSSSRLPQSEVTPNHQPSGFHTIPHYRFYRPQKNLSSLSIQSAPNLEAGYNSNAFVQSLSPAKMASLMRRRQSHQENMSMSFHQTFDDSLTPQNYYQNYGYLSPTPFIPSARSYPFSKELKLTNQLNFSFSKLNYPFKNIYLSPTYFNPSAKDQSYCKDVKPVNKKSASSKKNAKGASKKDKHKYVALSEKMMELRSEKEPTWFGRSLDSLWYIPNSSRRRKKCREKIKTEWLH